MNSGKLVLLVVGVLVPTMVASPVLVKKSFVIIHANNSNYSDIQHVDRSDYYGGGIIDGGRLN